MRRLAIAAVLAGTAVTASVAATPRELSTYVALDADRDGAISVGDTIGWFVDAPGAVTLRCWAADDTTAPLVATYVSPPFAPKVRHEGTGRSYVLTAAGYCESTGAGGGRHWFLVEP